MANRVAQTNFRRKKSQRTPVELATKWIAAELKFDRRNKYSTKLTLIPGQTYGMQRKKKRRKKTVLFRNIRNGASTRSWQGAGATLVALIAATRLLSSLFGFPKQNAIFYTRNY